MEEQMLRSKISLFGLACGVALLALTPAYGTIIDGSQLHIAGDADVGANFLNWLCDQPGDTTCPVMNHGDYSVTSSTGSFAQYNGSFGLISNINDASQPLNTVFSDPNFMTFDLNGNETIELTFIPLGTDTVSPDCVGLTHCTPSNPALITANDPGGVSPFNLDQNSLGTAANFAVEGFVHDSNGQIGILTGIFSAEFVGKNPAQVLAQILTGNGESTYSANFVVALAPEPMTLALMGSGLLAIGLITRRRKK